MSTASEIHNEIMEVLQNALKDKTTTYADVFGAIEITKEFFTCEYAMKVSITLRNALVENDGSA